MSEQNNKNKVEDIFAEVDKVEEKTNVKLSEPTYYIEDDKADANNQDFNSRLNYKKIIIIVVIVLFVVASGIFVYANFIRQNQENADLMQNNNLNTEQENVNNNQEENNIADNTDFINNENNEQESQMQENYDKDNDGLTDKAEKEYNTNPNKADTDSDGLFDGEEVDFYKTNPIIADTDGDGYLDGEEVKAGFDPLGPGKLLNFQEELRKLQSQ